MTEKKTSLPSTELHAVFGAGGSKAILGGTGAILAFHVLGLTKWKSLGGASGGFVPSILLAAQKHPSAFLAHVIETDFEGLLTPRTSLLGRLFALMRKYHYEHTRPTLGVYRTHMFMEFVDQTVPQWPVNFWTPAACLHGQVLFTWGGAFKYPHTDLTRTALVDEPQLLDDKPPRVGLAAGATCAIPGIMDAIYYRGEYLVDGALAGDGDTPIGVVARHFGDNPREKVIAIDVGDENLKKSWWVRLMFSVGCGGRCKTPIEGRPANDDEALVVIRPDLREFYSLQFTLHRDLKWKAVVAGFVATVEAMDKIGLTPEATGATARQYAAELKHIVSTVGEEGKISCAIEAYLGERGLYVPTHQC